jgi:short-subunit dehydrogenase involved in D-alanine esterification of teichoic acids
MNGNTVLVTGGTSGIGLGLALRLHDAGNKVLVAGRRKELLDRIVTEHPGVEAVVLDVAEPDSIASALHSVTHDYPELNVLVNMAGVMLPEKLLEPDALEIAETTVATNLLGTIRMVHAFLPFLVQKQNAVVVNVSSGLAFVPLPMTPTYNATKAAVHAFTESMRVQLTDTPVQVIELVPPPVRTGLMHQENNEQSMPLAEFLSEVMALLEAQPEGREIVVERAKFLRYAEANGTYDDVLKMLSSH